MAFRERILTTALRWAAATAVFASLGGAAPAVAFDSGPHGDITVDALQAEGFGLHAARVVWAENYFVDFYSQWSVDPYSGHASAKVVAAAQPISPFEYENWPDAVMRAASRSHFDATERPTGFADTAAVTAEWSRLRRATYRLVKAAQADPVSLRRPLRVLAAIGMSLHQVQDFYAHSNWVEQAGDRGSAPGWNPEVEGTVPTWFDVPAPRRGDVYTSGAPGHRTHGSWQEDGNRDLLNGLNKDWPGRPRYTDAYMASYFATRQWVQAIRTWLGDPALWAAAQRYAAEPNQLADDINEGVLAVSRAAGRLYGGGGPCQPDVSFDTGPTCGTGEGFGGTLLGARSTIKDYHGDANPTIFRKIFEELVPGLVADPPEVTEAMVPVPSSRPLQEATQFVRLRFTSVRGIDLEDPLPSDGADLYGRATIAGQDYSSGVIDDHDAFAFPRPYAPFTFIRAIGRTATFSAPVTSIRVRIHTGDVRFAGTDDDVYLRLSDSLRFPLDKRLYNDFERNDTDTYSVPIDAAARRGLSLQDLQYVQIEKSSDGAGGGWRLGGVKVLVNDRTVVDQPAINRWLENGRRTWRTAIPRDRRTAADVPVWMDLRDEDGFLYGDDDQGDIHPDDNRDALVRSYLPGPASSRTTTGGNAYGGRLVKGGDKATISYSLDTLPFRLGTGRQVDPGQVQPAPVAASTSPAPAAAPTPPPLKPDLVLTGLEQFTLTVANRGQAPAGAFTVSVTNFRPVRVPGLAAGSSVTVTFGDKCMSSLRAVADALGEIDESDESNNVREIAGGC